MTPEQLEALFAHIEGAVRRAAVDIAAAQTGRLVSIDSRLGKLETTVSLAIDNMRTQTEEIGRLRAENHRLLTLVPPPCEAVERSGA